MNFNANFNTPEGACFWSLYDRLSNGACHLYIAHPEHSYGSTPEAAARNLAELQAMVKEAFAERRHVSFETQETNSKVHTFYYCGEPCEENGYVTYVNYRLTLGGYCAIKLEKVNTVAEEVGAGDHAIEKVYGYAILEKNELRFECSLSRIVFISDDAEWAHERAIRNMKELKENYEASYDTPIEMKLIALEIGNPAKVMNTLKGIDISKSRYEYINSVYIDENSVAFSDEIKTWGKEAEIPEPQYIND
jgi:hypothetical protein